MCKENHLYEHFLQKNERILQKHQIIIIKKCTHKFRKSELTTHI